MIDIINPIAFIYTVLVIGAIGALCLGDRMSREQHSNKPILISGAIAFVALYIVIVGIMSGVTS